MAEQIYIGNFPKGQVTNRPAFAIDNDSFPYLFNAYTWRGRVKRKRGTALLGQLQRQLQITNAPNNFQVQSFVLVAGAGNLISQFTLGSTANITPGSLSLTVSADQTYTDLNKDGTLQGSGGGTGTINYATGAFTVSGSVAGTVTGTFSYYPGLPVMGLRDFIFTSNLGAPSPGALYPVLLSFDTTFSYQITQGNPATFYNVNYYKISQNPFKWSGGDANQFWTTNYEASLWATNNKPGFHFMTILSIVTGPTTTINTSTPHTLLTGDWVWFNEITGADASVLNLQTAQVTVTGPTQFTVPINSAGKVVNSPSGIFQMLTQSLTGQDGIKWYDGDPTNTTGIPTASGLGWVNFAPPLSGTGQIIENYTSATTPFYLVGALAIVAFKDRLIFFSPYIQNTANGSTPFQLQDAVIWSWNGTPYYTSTGQGTKVSPYLPGLTPGTTGTSQLAANPKAYYLDQTGLGGYLAAGISKPILTVANNEDVLLVGFGGTGRKTRFVYTGNDYQPFLFYSINSELPSNSTFSAIVLDKGAIDIGAYGIAITDQQSCNRIDLDIPDSVFDIQTANFGSQRVNAIRDFFREWIYFCYPVDGSATKFPTQSFLYNYRDNTWGVLYENFTTHGTYRPAAPFTWATCPFPTWNDWQEPWDSGSNFAEFPDIVAGNPQGYVLVKDQGLGEGSSGTIQNVINNGGFTQIASINHCVEANNPGLGNGDYLLIQGCLGTTALNGAIGLVTKVIDANNFVIDIPFPAGTYLGLGKYVRLSQPLIQTKQFMPYWEQGKQCRLSVQKYLMDATANGQVTVNIYLSQDDVTPWNNAGTVNPAPNGLVYSQIMFTCPELGNLGLTPPNINLQMPTAATQQQIWHRFGTSMIGDSVQIGITIGNDTPGKQDAQMRNLEFATSEITLHGIHLTVEKGPHLA